MKREETIDNKTDDETDKIFGRAVVVETPRTADKDQSSLLQEKQ